MSAISKERLINVLIAPHVSEKSARIADQGNQYVFRVRTDATKPEIRAAVEFMFTSRSTPCGSSTWRARTSGSGAPRAAGRTGRKPMCAWLRARTSRWAANSAPETRTGHGTEAN